MTGVSTWGLGKARGQPVMLFASPALLFFNQCWLEGKRPPFCRLVFLLSLISFVLIVLLYKYNTLCHLSTFPCTPHSCPSLSLSVSPSCHSTAPCCMLGKRIWQQIGTWNLLASPLSSSTLLCSSQAHPSSWHLTPAQISPHPCPLLLRLPATLVPSVTLC